MSETLTQLLVVSSNIWNKPWMLSHFGPRLTDASVIRQNVAALSLNTGFDTVVESLNAAAPPAEEQVDPVAVQLQFTPEEIAARKKSVAKVVLGYRNKKNAPDELALSNFAPVPHRPKKTNLCAVAAPAPPAEPEPEPLPADEEGQVSDEPEQETVPADEVDPEVLPDNDDDVVDDMPPDDEEDEEPPAQTQPPPPPVQKAVPRVSLKMPKQALPPIEEEDDEEEEDDDESAPLGSDSAAEEANGEDLEDESRSEDDDDEEDEVPAKKSRALPPVNMPYEQRYAASIARVHQKDEEKQVKKGKAKGKQRVQMVAATPENKPLSSYKSPAKAAGKKAAGAKPVDGATLKQRLLQREEPFDYTTLIGPELANRSAHTAVLTQLVSASPPSGTIFDAHTVKSFHACWRAAVRLVLAKHFTATKAAAFDAAGVAFESQILDNAKPIVCAPLPDKQELADVRRWQGAMWAYKKLVIHAEPACEETSRCQLILTEPMDHQQLYRSVRTVITCVLMELPALAGIRVALRPWEFCCERADRTVNLVMSSQASITEAKLLALLTAESSEYWKLVYIDWHNAFHLSRLTETF